MAPPGAAKLGGAYVPPPPGVTPPGPQLPDVKNDPFGAMNAMAAHGAVTRAPEVIVVDHTVQKVEEGSKAARYGKVALAILAPLVIGFLVGGINYERRRYNANLADAKLLFEEVHQVGRSLEDLNTVLLTSRSEGKPKVFDIKLVTALEQLNFNLADDDKLILFHRNLYALEPKLVQDTLTFYQRIRALTARVKDHIRLTKLSAPNGTPAEEPKPPANLTTFYAVLLHPPTEKDAAAGARIQAELVQIGQGVCADGKAADRCPEGPPAQVQYRGDPGLAFAPKALAVAADTTDKLIPVPYSDLLRALHVGADKALDEQMYWRRLSEIEFLVHGNDGESGLMKDRKDIEDRMNNVAQQKKALAL